MRNTLAAAILVTASLALTGCATHAAAAKPTKPALPHIYAGENAATIAGHIKGCTNVHEIASTGGPASVAQCTLDGRLLDIDSWRAPNSPTSIANTLAADNVEYYFTAGTTWTVLPADDPTAQMQVTDDAGGLVKQAFAGVSDSQGDVPGQKESAEIVARSLGGKMYHVEG